jgi:hypothetical protein
MAAIDPLTHKDTNEVSNYLRRRVNPFLTLKASKLIAGGKARSATPPDTNHEMTPTLKGSHNVRHSATPSGSELIVALTGGVAPGYYMSHLRRDELIPTASNKSTCRLPSGTDLLVVNSI